MNVQELKDSLVENIYRDSKLITGSVFNANDSSCVLAFHMLIKSILTFCFVCEYVPDGMTVGSLYNAMYGKLDANTCKLVLRDAVVTTGLRNTTHPVDVEAIYQIVYDRNYKFIPLDQRPKDDFMNPPE